MRGYCGIGIVETKTPQNVGGLWRSAGILGASYIFTAGRRYPQQAADTIKAWRHIPLFEFDTPEDLLENIPRGCIPVGVEISERARPLEKFHHPERAVYVLGAEDTGIPPRILSRLPHVVQLPGDRCLNVATAGGIVLYDRLLKRGGATA